MKKTLVSMLAVLSGLAALPASAHTLECAPPVLQVPSGGGTAHYTISCVGVGYRTLTPMLSFSGEMYANGTPPYRVTPSYSIDIRNLAERKLNDEPRVDQVLTGSLQASTVSLAALPTELSNRIAWDSKAGAMSVEEKPGRWHVYTIRLGAEVGEASLVDAGFSSVPVKDGRASVKLVFDKGYSRFAGKGDTLPVVSAEVGLQEGKLELLVGESRVASQAGVQGALLMLDRKPKDIARAWALASRAKFLGLENEVRYAEQKVAAHNPQLLEEFQRGLSRIQPYVLPKL